MEWKNKPIDWQNEGQAPNEDLKKEGFRKGYRPTAAIMSHLMHNQSSVLKELQGGVDNLDTLVATRIAEIEANISKKVDKENGKSLTTNDFTTEHRSKSSIVKTDQPTDTFLSGDGTYREVVTSARAARAARAVKTDATITIGVSNGVGYTAGNVDYYLQPTDDVGATINRVVQGSNGYVKIVLLNGAYQSKTTILIDKPCVTLCGENKNTVKIEYVSDGIADTAIKLAADKSYIKDLTLTANKPVTVQKSRTVGITTTGFGGNAKVENVNVYDFLFCISVSDTIMIKDCTLRCGDGIRFEDMATTDMSRTNVYGIGVYCVNQQGITIAAINNDIASRKVIYEGGEDKRPMGIHVFSDNEQYNISFLAENNNISNLWRGMNINVVEEAVFNQNTINDNDMALQLTRVNKVRIFNNLVKNVAASAIWVETSVAGDVIIQGNFATGTKKARSGRFITVNSDSKSIVYSDCVVNINNNCSTVNFDSGIYVTSNMLGATLQNVLIDSNIIVNSTVGIYLYRVNNIVVSNNVTLGAFQLGLSEFFNITNNLVVLMTDYGALFWVYDASRYGVISGNVVAISTARNPMNQLASETTQILVTNNIFPFAFDNYGTDNTTTNNVIAPIPYTP